MDISDKPYIALNTAKNKATFTSFEVYFRQHFVGSAKPILHRLHHKTNMYKVRV